MSYKDIIVSGNNAVNAVRAMDNDALNALSFEDRFAYVATIRNGIYAQFPAPEDDPYQEIDLNDISQYHIAVLTRLTNSLRLSDEYKNFIISVTEEAVDALTNSAQIVDLLLKWNEINLKDKISLAQHFHESIIDCAKRALEKKKANSGLTSLFKPLTISAFSEEPTFFEDEAGILESSFNGYAALTHNEWPAVEKLGINVHEKSSFGRVEDAIEILAHESAHVIEGFLAYTFYHHAPFIPDGLIKDAKLLFHMYENDAYEMVRLYPIYENQANEVMAREAGSIAKEKVLRAMYP